MRGGWDGEAGRLVLAVHTAYWVRDALRAEEADCRLVVADGRISVRAPWQDPSGGAVRRAHGRTRDPVAAAPATARRHRLRRRLLADGPGLRARIRLPPA
ncbi:hypothetical protein AB0O57_03995 [Streptomyces sp. NPDC091201]|uniref:hypothetical protein n=1 Tax=Streptomyces sp. NPDC091201 TaxID=3155190 RepID=UPI003435FF5A